jgi:RNA polymerase sigma-70 factor (ECF subfamily)
MDDMHQIYRQRAQTVYKFLLSLCGDGDLAEELTQETFYQAIRSIDRFDGGCKLSVWLCQIAKHLWYQQARKSRREMAAEELPEVPVPSAEEAALSGVSQIELLKRVHALPEHQKEVVYLRSFGGLSFREIGDVLGRTETWARVTFHRGREALRKGGEQDEK